MKNWEKLIKKYWRKEEKNLRFIKTITINNKKYIINTFLKLKCGNFTVSLFLKYKQ